ncbi:hypothetical protein [Nocardia spumae]|nr:hypothetical protein [Nocardia spumae]
MRHRGSSPDLGGSWSLPEIVGLQQAKRLARIYAGTSEVMKTISAKSPAL